MFCTDELRLCQESRVAQIPKVFNMHMGFYFPLLCLCQKLSFPKYEGNCSKQQLVLHYYYQSLTHVYLVDTQRSFFWLFETWKFAKTCLVIGGVTKECIIRWEPRALSLKSPMTVLWPPQLDSSHSYHFWSRGIWPCSWSTNSTASHTTLTLTLWLWTLKYWDTGKIYGLG